jgi:hypothetical protein
MQRKRKLRLVQLSLLCLGFFVIIYTYVDNGKNIKTKIITKETQKKIQKQIEEKTQEGNTFYNIKYSGLDLSGSRYIVKAKEANTSKTNNEIVNMKGVEATFYFKDNTVLEVSSSKGVYNNNTLDMKFANNVRGRYGDSRLFAEKAYYSNINSFLTVTEKVRIEDIRGTMLADKLLFDIKKQTLNIASFDNDKINANVNIK